MAIVSSSVAEVCEHAKRASRALASVDAQTKNRALGAISDALLERAQEILDANARDLEAGREHGLTDALLDRLALNPSRLATIATQVRDIAALPDPVGEIIEGGRLPNGLDVRKVRVPLGVIAVVYEARPNVTIDAAALCLKSGNAIVLRGSSSAAHSNAALAGIAAEAALGTAAVPSRIGALHAPPLSPQADFAQQALRNVGPDAIPALVKAVRTGDDTTARFGLGSVSSPDGPANPLF